MIFFFDNLPTIIIFNESFNLYIFPILFFERDKIFDLSIGLYICIEFKL